MHRARGGPEDAEAAAAYADRALELARGFGYTGVERRIAEFVTA